MVEKTILAIPGGRKASVPRLFKRLLQTALAVGLASFVFLVIIAGNGLLVGRATLQAGMTTWLAFMKRPDTLAIMTITAIVTILLVYWMREHERK